MRFNSYQEWLDFINQFHPPIICDMSGDDRFYFDQILELCRLAHPIFDQETILRQFHTEVNYLHLVNLLHHFNKKFDELSDAITWYILKFS